MKAMRNVQAGKPVGGVMAYLAVPLQQRCSASNEGDFLDSRVLLDAYKHVAHR